MESMQEKESTMQVQLKDQENHQIPTSLSHEKVGLDATESLDHHHQQEEQQKQPNESKTEKQRTSVETDECKNGGKDERGNLEKKSSSHAKTEKGLENGGFLGPRERLKRHRTEVAGQVWIPDMWGQEDFLKDWIDCSGFEASLVPQNIMLARASLMKEGRTSNSTSFRLQNSC